MTLVGQWTARQLCIAVGYIYPLYKSSRAVRREDKSELLQWITFWTTNALFWVVELVGDTVISWVPFYYEAKIALLLWLVLPQYHGARVLHDKWLAPTFEKHEEVIDVTITDIKRRASGMVVQVCKDTAAIAIKRGSGVMAQGQQYVATQLVQQALGKLQQPAANSDSQTHELRMPAIMSFLTTAVSSSTATTSSSSPSATPLARKSIVVPPILSESKEDTTSKPVDAMEKKKTLEHAEPKRTVKTDVDAKTVEAKAENKTTDTMVSDAKTSDATTSSKQKKPQSPKSRAPVPPPKSPSKNTVVAATTATPATRPGTQEKSKELLSHFKKLLVKGFQLHYYPSEGDAKRRVLRLASAQSRYLVFESASAASAAATDASKTKKSVKLFVHNIRRVASCKPGDDGVPAESTIKETLAFVLENGKSTLVFEAENTKTRDLLVAGMRLLVNEHKRNDTVALATLTDLLETNLKQHAFIKLANAVAHKRHREERAGGDGSEVEF